MTETEAPQGASPDIHLEEVTKRFGEMTAVDRLTLSIERGSFFAMLGPSGCGKTTTLRMIGGFEDPTAGRVLLGGEDVTEQPPYRRDVNTVFQSYALFPHLNVERNVGFGLERRGIAKAEVRTRVGETLELVQLHGLGRRKPGQLSGGQQQRVALARALVNRPRALLLDEPLGALDLRLRRQLQIELKRIQQDVGITFVHVTHDQEEAMTMADEIAVMSDGPHRAGGRRRGPLRAPAHRLRRQLPGDLEPDRRPPRRDHGRPDERRDARRRDAAGAPRARRPARHGRRQCRRAPREDRRSSRPEATPRPGTNVLRGTVIVASFLGVSIQYLVRTAGGEELTVIAQNADGAGADAFAVGREVQLAWKPTHTFVVAKESPDEQ